MVANGFDNRRNASGRGGIAIISIAAVMGRLTGIGASV